MNHGKFDGMVVNVDANGKTFHGTFVDGHKSKDWTRGPAPAGALAVSDQRREEKVRADVVAETEPPAPAAGPSSIPAKKIEQPSVAETAVKTETPNPEMDDSLQSLVGAPPVIRRKENVAVEAAPELRAPARSTSSPSPVGPKLTAAEVIELANAEAHKRGYNPGEYQKPLADYHAEDESWSVVYDQKNANGIGKHFSVSVEDQSKKAALGR